MFGIRSFFLFFGLFCIGFCVGGIVWGFRFFNVVRGGRDIFILELEMLFKGDDLLFIFDGFFGKLKGGSELEFFVIGGNKLVVFGKGLGLICLDEFGIFGLFGMLVVLLGFIILGVGFIKGGNFVFEEFWISYLEFGLFDGKELVCLFGVSGENCLGWLLGINGGIWLCVKNGRFGRFGKFGWLGRFDVGLLLLIEWIFVGFIVFYKIKFKLFFNIFFKLMLWLVIIW